MIAIRNVKREDELLNTAGNYTAEISCGNFTARALFYMHVLTSKLSDCFIMAS